MFLICHSILMAGLALGSSAPQNILLLLTTVGFIISAIWVYVGHRTLKVADYYATLVRTGEVALPAEDRIYSNAHDWRRTAANKPLFGIRVSTYLARALPILWFIMWLAAFTWQIISWWRLR